MPVTSFVSLLVDIPLTSHFQLRSLEYVNHYDTSTRYQDCQAITLYPLSVVYNMEQTLIVKRCTLDNDNDTVSLHPIIHNIFLLEPTQAEKLFDICLDFKNRFSFWSYSILFHSTSSVMITIEQSVMCSLILCQPNLVPIRIIVRCLSAVNLSTRIIHAPFSLK